MVFMRSNIIHGKTNLGHKVFQGRFSISLTEKTINFTSAFKANCP